jgi:hypothetical protein
MSEHEKLVEAVALEVSKSTCSLWVQTWHRDLARSIIAIIADRSALTPPAPPQRNGE